MTQTRQQILLYEETKKLQEKLNDNEIATIFETIKKSRSYPKSDWGIFMKIRDYVLISFIYILGLRPREACWLRFDDFDMENLMLKIRGENNKQRKDRFLPITNKIIKLLKAYLSLNRARFWRGSQYLFPSLQNEKISPNRMKARFRQILKEAGLYQIIGFRSNTNQPIPKFRLYSLRHSFGSKIYNQTKDIFLVANLMGHGKISSTKRYIHTDENYINYERQILNEL